MKSINKDIPFLHRGGCGIFAVLLWDMLTFQGYLTEPVEMYDDYPDFTRNHILLKYNDIYFDSHGVQRSTDWMGFTVEHTIRLDGLQQRAWDDNIWFNGINCFDRKNIVKLKKRIHQLGYKVGEAKKLALISDFVSI